MTAERFVELNPDFFNKNWRGEPMDGYIHVGVGKGWYSLIAQLAKIAPEGTYAQQIKEKFGAMSCYVNDADDGYWAVDDMITNLSLGTCEQCGTQQNVETKSKNYWIKTLCESCRNAK